MAVKPSQLPPNTYATFAGAIDQTTVPRIINSLTLLTQQTSVKHVHVFFHSAGGNVGDGIALYSFFRSFPLELTVYNPALVGSIAVVAYLGAKTRKTSAHAVFGLHRTSGNAQAASSDTLEKMAQSAIIDNRRTEAIIRERCAIPEERWPDLDGYGITLTAEEAVKYGIAHEVSDFSPPPGTLMWTLT